MAHGFVRDIEYRPRTREQNPTLLQWQNLPLPLRDRTLGYLFLAPALLVILVLVIYPFVGAVFLTFQSKTAGAPGTWVGLNNYRELLSNEVFSRTVYNSIFYTVVAVALKFVFGLSMALVLNQERLFNNFSLLPAHPLGHSHGDLGVELALDLRRRQRAHQQRARAPGADRRDDFLALDPNLAMFSVIVVVVWQGTPFLPWASWPACSPSPRSLRSG